jgi:hypothetical protein
MGNKFLLLNIILTNELCSNNWCYWRTGIGTNNPPLEILIDNISGIIKKITLFISEDEFIKDKDIKFIEEYAEPIFETSILIDKYNNHADKYQVWVNGMKLYCIFEDGGDVEKKINISHDIGCFLNKNNQLIGFCVQNSEEDIEYFKEARLL